MLFATMDHAHIRGLATDTSSFRRGAACTLVAEIIALDAHITRSRIPLIGELRIALRVRTFANCCTSVLLSVLPACLATDFGASRSAVRSGLRGLGGAVKGGVPPRRSEPLTARRGPNNRAPWPSPGFTGAASKIEFRSVHGSDFSLTLTFRQLSPGGRCPR